MRLFDRRALVAAALVLPLAVGAAACDKKAGGAAISSEDMTLGDPKAPITVTEYASASCVHCAAWNEEVFPAFKAKYIDTGKVRYVMREFLTPPPEVAAAGFLTARCVAKGDDAKYFAVLDTVYKGQKEMFSTGDYRGVLLRIAQSAGLTEAQFDACVSDEAALQNLNDRVEKYIKESKVTGTPAFFVNDKLIGISEMPLEKLDAAIAEAQAGK